MLMTPRQRVMAALRGEKTDKVPFTIYNDQLPVCTAERELRNRGICLVKRITSYSFRSPNVKTESHHYNDERGRSLIRTTLSTPVGELSSLAEPAGYTTWHHEKLFKGPEDYKAILFTIKDAQVEPNYAAAIHALDELGDDHVVRDNLPLEPMQSLISGGYMSMEDFCIEWMDRRDEILTLYDALVEQARQIWPIVANGPLEHVNYGGNVVPQLIGVERFEKYFVPIYNEAADVLHAKGKMIGTHLDDNNALIMDSVAKTRLDYIEAYDPGMSPAVDVAFAAWPDKALWINWPSAEHLKTPSQVKQRTLEMIEQSADNPRFIIGITENIPAERWKANLNAIMDAIDEAS